MKKGSHLMPSLVGGGSGGENASANTVKSRLH